MIKIYDQATFKGLTNPLFSIKDDAHTTINSAGSTIEQYGIYELVKPNYDKPCFVVKTKSKPLAYVKEVSIPNQHIKALPLSRVPWNLCTEPQPYESTEKLFEEIRECLQKYLETPKPEDLTVIASFVMMT